MRVYIPTDSAKIAGSTNAGSASGSGSSCSTVPVAAGRSGKAPGVGVPEVAPYIDARNRSTLGLSSASATPGSWKYST